MRYLKYSMMVGSMLFLSIVSMSFSKSASTATVQPWQHQPIQFTVEDTTFKTFVNDAQQRFSVKYYAVGTAYAQIQSYILSLPVDSTRTLQTLADKNPKVLPALENLIRQKSKLSDFQYTSDSSGHLVISIQPTLVVTLFQPFMKPEKPVKPESSKQKAVSSKKEAKTTVKPAEKESQKEKSDEASKPAPQPAPVVADTTQAAEKKVTPIENKKPESAIKPVPPPAPVVADTTQAAVNKATPIKNKKPVPMIRPVPQPAPVVSDTTKTAGKAVTPVEKEKPGVGIKSVPQETPVVSDTTKSITKDVKKEGQPDSSKPKDTSNP